jgi:Uma2 family endonuclease
MDPVLHEPHKKFTVDDVMNMLAAGILNEDDRVELIEGELLIMSPHDPPHASTVQKLTRRLFEAYGPGYDVRCQLPLVASSFSMPEPDVAVVRGGGDAFEDRHPTGREAVLVIEVTWSTQQRDRLKAGIYGRAGVPVYWRLDVENRRLETQVGPTHDGVYSLVRVHDEAAEVEVPGTSTRWRVRDLLPTR